MAERLTFEQREGLAELPSQLQPRTLSKELRALQGSFGDVLGFVEFVLRHPSRRNSFVAQVAEALQTSRAAYRLVDGDTIGPFASKAEGAAMSAAIEAAAAAGLQGARRHLKQAASFATAGAWADSVRESIHAVESIAVTLDPAATTLGPALKSVAERTGMHPALREALSRLYGYTSDESGIRHALLEGDANVDEADALFMLGACSSFVTFLIAKSRSAGLLSKDGA